MTKGVAAIRGCKKMSKPMRARTRTICKWDGGHVLGGKKWSRLARKNGPRRGEQLRVRSKPGASVSSKPHG